MSNQEYYLEQDEICTEDDSAQVEKEMEENVLLPICTEEKETNTECNFCPEGPKRRITSLMNTDDRLSIKRSQTFSPTPQLAKNQYICR